MIKICHVALLTFMLCSCFDKNNSTKHQLETPSPVLEKAYKTSYDWLLQYKGKSTNALISDERFFAIHKNSIPRHSFSKLLGFETTFTDSYNQVIGGPPDPIMFNEEHNYFVLSACRLHFCPEKGFMWFNYETEKGIVAIVHYFTKQGEPVDFPLVTIASNNYKNLKEIPEMAILEVRTWLKEKHIAVAQNDWKFYE